MSLPEKNDGLGEQRTMRERIIHIIMGRGHHCYFVQVSISFDHGPS